MFFQIFSFFFFNIFLCLFILTFYVCMKLGETVTFLVLKMCSYVGVSLRSLCVPNVFGGTTRSEVNIFPPWVGGRPGAQVARTRARYERELSLPSQGEESMVEELEQKLWGILISPSYNSSYVLVWDVARAWELGLHFSPYPPVLMSCLVTCSGPEGLVPQHWGGLTPYQIFTGLGAQVLVFSALELASPPLECMQGSPFPLHKSQDVTGCLCPVQRQGRVRTRYVPHKYMHSH